MQYIKAMIVDDEELVLENLKIMLRQFPRIEIIYESTSSLRVLEKSDRWDGIDIAILDINMPGLSGIDLAKKIFSINPSIKIIFLTAYEEYVLDAMESNVIDYILKPVTIRRFQRTMNKLESLIGSEQEKLAEAIRRGEQSSSDHFVGTRDGSRYIIELREGCYITIDGRDVILVTEEGSYTLGHSLNEWEAFLSGRGWFRCHKAFLVNLSRIRSISPMVNSTCSLRLGDLKEEIPVSRSYSGEFRRIMGI